MEQQKTGKADLSNRGRALKSYSAARSSVVRQGGEVTSVAFHPVCFDDEQSPFSMSEIESFGLSHIGPVREENQDAVRLCSSTDETTIRHGYLYGIADGMGGYSHGSVASDLALTAFFKTFYESEESTVAGKLRQGTRIANLEVLQRASQIGAVRMGTTLTVAHIFGNRLSLAHVGDSRAYLVRRQNLVCLTNDHSKVGEMARMRLIPPEKVRTHYQRSIITKSIGFDLFVQPDIESKILLPGDVILLCTDGVWCVIEDADFVELGSQSTSAEEYAQRIIALSLERHSDDNVSVVVLKIHNIDRIAEPSEKAKWKFLNLWHREKRSRSV